MALSVAVVIVLLSFPAENLERIQAVAFRSPPPGSPPPAPPPGSAPVPAR